MASCCLTYYIGQFPEPKDAGQVTLKPAFLFVIKIIMSTYEVISLILTSATIFLAIVSICIAITSSQKTAQEAAKQINAIREANKNEIEHQGKIAWSIIQNYYSLNMFGLAEDKNQLAIIQNELKKEKKGSKQSKQLIQQEHLLSCRIKNREITNGNYDKLIKELRLSTNIILKADELI